MRILIIALPRSGSKVLTKWLSKELGYKEFIEPHRMPNTEGIEGDNVVVKWDSWEIEVVPNNVFNQKWDKVILLSREDTYDQSISLTRARERGDTWWAGAQYTITQEWIKRNEIKIQLRKEYFDREREKLNLYNGFHITYEGIYIRGEHREILRNQLGVSEWKHSEIIHPDLRYRKPLKTI